MTNTDKLAFCVVGVILILAVIVILALIFIPSFEASRAYAAGALLATLATTAGMILGLSKTRQLDREKSNGPSNGIS